MGSRSRFEQGDDGAHEPAQGPQAPQVQPQAEGRQFAVELGGAAHAPARPEVGRLAAVGAGEGLENPTKGLLLEFCEGAVGAHVGISFLDAPSGAHR